MRKIIWLSGALSVVIVASGCSKVQELLSPAESPPTEEASAAQEPVAEAAAPLEAAAPDPAGEALIDAAGEAAAGGASGGGGDAGEAAAAAAAAAGEQPPKIELFRAALVKEGFVAIGVEPLLPDVLGGLREECAALERNRVNLENEDWTNLGIFESPERAKTCLAAYLNTPGAGKFRNSYVQSGPYLLEVRPSMDNARQSRIKDLFAKVVAE